MDYVNAMFEELQIREAAIKESQKRVDEIKAWCREQGSFTTDRYICSVTPRVRTSLVSLDKVAEIIGWEIIEKENLIKTTEYLTVQIIQIDSVMKELKS